MTRTFLSWLWLVALGGCGGLSNLELLRGVIQGSLQNPDATASVEVLGHPEIHAAPTPAELAALSTQADPSWAFELDGVPKGRVELLMFISQNRADRLATDLEGGEVEKLEERVGNPISTIRADLDGPSHQLIRQGRVTVLQTSLYRDIAASDLNILVPAGCYTLEASVPGLGTQQGSGCVGSGLTQKVHITFDPISGPDAGCIITGCESEHPVCRPSGDCVEEP